MLYLLCTNYRSEIVVPVWGYNYHNEADVPATAGAAKKVGCVYVCNVCLRSSDHWLMPKLG